MNSTEQRQGPKHRIIRNTLYTYARSVATALLAILSSRWVLQSLGHKDYGIYSLVGALILFVVFLSGVLSGSSARFFAYNNSSDNPANVIPWFRASFFLHLALGVILIVIGWPVGEFIIFHTLNIPTDRIESALWVLRISLLTSLISIVTAPFIAMFTAKQFIAELAIWAFFQSFLSFLLAWSLAYAPGDKLVVYAAGIGSIFIAVQCSRVVVALRRFPECRLGIHGIPEPSKIRALLVFSFWYLLGGAGNLLRDQGTAIILNSFGGPPLNAAYGISNQVSSQVNQLSSALTNSFAPEITSKEGAGDRPRVLELANQANLYGALLALIFTVPLFLEMDLILQIWLTTPPEHTSSFCRMVLAAFCLERLSSGTNLALYAKGKIASLQTAVGLAMIATLPMTWWLLTKGASPDMIWVTFISSVAAINLIRVVWARNLLRAHALDWAKSVVAPFTLVAATSFSIGAIPLFLLPESFMRTILVGAASVLATAMASWLFAMDRSKRKTVRDYFGWMKPTQAMT